MKYQKSEVKRMELKLPKELHTNIAVEAALQGITKTEVVHCALKKYFEEKHEIKKVTAA